MSSQSLLTGCGAVVSGGSRGIGRAVAELLGNLGAGVVVNGRDADAVQATVAAITAPGGQATSVVGAADDEHIATALIEECTRTYGRLDILINCAGIVEPTGSSILNISSEEFDRLISVHLGTAFHTCRNAARVMTAPGARGDHQHQLRGISRRLRRHRLPSGQGRRERADDGHRR
jgi:3-oxoacyl-[acyl-carrier protein] reductase